MTTLRRELRTRFEEVLQAFKNRLSQAEITATAGELADAALEISGISKPKKFSDPYWDLLHGKNPEALEIAERVEAYTNIADRLSTGLKRGEFPQTYDAQKVYKWIAERESSGQSLDRFITWAMEGRRAEYSFIYHKDPTLIKRDWLQVFPVSTEIAQPDSDGGFR